MHLYILMKLKWSIHHPAKGKLFCKLIQLLLDPWPNCLHGFSDIVFTNHGSLHNPQAIRLFLETATTDMHMDYHPCHLTLGWVWWFQQKLQPLLLHLQCTSSPNLVEKVLTKNNVHGINIFRVWTLSIDEQAKNLIGWLPKFAKPKIW
jgi:hypothetical protein